MKEAAMAQGSFSTAANRRPMRNTVSRGARVGWWSLAVGSLFVVAGLAVMAMLFAIVYGDGELPERLAFQLGLGSVILISGAAQVLELVGLWLAWSAFHPSARR
jgi:hypothetical protein